MSKVSTGHFFKTIKLPPNFNDYFMLSLCTRKIKRVHQNVFFIVRGFEMPQKNITIKKNLNIFLRSLSLDISK